MPNTSARQTQFNSSTITLILLFQGENTLPFKSTNMRYIILKILFIVVGILALICLSFGVLQQDALFIGIGVLFILMSGLIHLESRQLRSNPFLK